MQSDGNSFCGDVVLDSFNMQYRDEDSILDQIHEKPIFSNFLYADLKFFRENKETAYLKKYFNWV